MILGRVKYPLNGKAGPKSRYDQRLSHDQRGTIAAEEQLEKMTREAGSFRKRLREQLERQTQRRKSSAPPWAEIGMPPLLGPLAM